MAGPQISPTQARPIVIPSSGNDIKLDVYANIFSRTVNEISTFYLFDQDVLYAVLFAQCGSWHRVNSDITFSLDLPLSGS